MIMDEAAKVVKSRKTGDAWCEQAVPVLVEVSRETKELEEKKKAECEPYRAQIATISESYKAGLDSLAEIDRVIRERVMTEHKGSEPVKVEGAGQLIFVETPTFEVVNIKKVDPRYLMVDRAAVMKDIKKGVRSIQGLDIRPGRQLRVLTEKGT